MNDKQNNSPQKANQIVDRAARALRELRVPEGPPREVVESVLAAGNQEQNQFQKRRFKMNRIMKVAAAILIVVGIGVVIELLTQGNGAASIAWADVQEKIRSIRAVKYTLSEYTLTQNGQEHFVRESQIMEDPSGRSRREKIRSGQSVKAWDIVIQDNSGKVLVLYTQSKNATLYEYAEWPKPSVQSLKERLKDLINTAPHTELGEKVINETTVKGYRIERSSSAEDRVTDIWVNAKSADPVTVETVWTLGDKKFKYIYTDYESNIDLDESLFSTSPPMGYTLNKETIPPFKPTVDDVVFVLRIWSQRNDGLFPDSLTLGNLTKGMSFEEFGEMFGGTRESGMKVNLALGLQREASARYLGKGVRFGDAETAIFWHRPKGSQMYKVIYGDLSIKEVAEGDLPR